MNHCIRRLVLPLAYILSCLSIAYADMVVQGDIEPVNVIIVDMPQDFFDGTDNKCSLREALYNASHNTQLSTAEGECPAGSATETDVIVLQSDVVYELLPSGLGQLEVIGNASEALELIIQTDGELPASIHQVASNRRAMTINNANVVIDNLVITGGNGVNYGSAIFIEDSRVELSRLNLHNNQADVGGAALYILNSSVELHGSHLELNNSVSGVGGAIHAHQSSLVISDSVLRANSAYIGGAIYSLGELEVFNSHFTLNQSTGLAEDLAGGGAIYASTVSKLLIEDSLFESNNAQGGDGGALLIHSPTPGIIKRTRFENNQALNGGAIDSVWNEVLEIEGGRFINNQAVEDGGAIRAANLVISNKVLLAPVELKNNSAGNDGGAIHAEFFAGNRLLVHENQAGARGGGVFLSKLGLIAHSRYESNTAGSHGGGLYYAASEGANSGSSVFRSSFMYNQANGLTGQGGGIWYGQGGSISNVTVYNNSSATGGGLYVHENANFGAYNITLSGHIAGQDLALLGGLDLQNSLIATVGQPNCASTGVAINSLGNNLSNDHSCPGLDPVQDLLGVDPRLLSAANGGHHTRVLPLAADSPAIDAGNNDACAAMPVNGVDQRLGVRPSGKRCDIGAYEHNAEVMFSKIFSDRFEEP